MGRSRLMQPSWDDDHDPPPCSECGSDTTERPDLCGVNYVCAECGYIYHQEDPRIAAAEME